jgi:hypothetical protein
MIAEQLLNLTPVPSGLGTASVRAPSEPWELRALRAESGFAPVDELGGRIFSFADKPTPEPPSSRRASDVIDALQSVQSQTALISQPGLPSASTKPDAIEVVGNLLKDLGLPPATTRPEAVEGTGLGSEPPRRSADGVATRLPDAAKFNLPKRELDSVAAANLTNVQIAVRDNPFTAQSQ